MNSNNYQWKSYPKVILSSGNDEQESQLQTEIIIGRHRIYNRVLIMSKLPL